MGEELSIESERVCGVVVQRILEEVEEEVEVAKLTELAVDVEDEMRDGAGKAKRKRASARKTTTLISSPKCCFNCGTMESPGWRRHAPTGNRLCNACGIYANTHGEMRPILRNKDGSHEQKKQKTTTTTPEALIIDKENGGGGGDGTREDEEEKSSRKKTRKVTNTRRKKADKTKQKNGCHSVADRNASTGNREDGDALTIGVRNASGAIATNNDDATGKSGGNAVKSNEEEEEKRDALDHIGGDGDTHAMLDGRGPNTIAADAAAPPPPPPPFLKCCQHLPHNLKQHLVTDYVMVKENDKLPRLSLPASPCVADILERWKDNAVDGKKRTIIRTIEQVVEGLKKYVNMLADEGMLFYAHEKAKYDIPIQEEKNSEHEARALTAHDGSDNVEVQEAKVEDTEAKINKKTKKQTKKGTKEKGKEERGEKEPDIECASAYPEACTLYGAEHLLRTIAVLPEIMARQDDVTASRLQNRIKELMRYLSDHYDELFTQEYRSKEEWLRAGDNPTDPANTPADKEVKPEEQAKEMQKDDDIALEEEEQ